MKYPLISIVLPCYNGATYLEEALKSCFLQTYQNLEFIYVDDCSTDDSCKIAERLQQEYPELKLEILRNEENLGLPATLNIGHQAAKGEYLTFTSDDNLLLPETIAQLYGKLIETSSDVVYADYLNINDQGESLNRMKLEAVSSVLFHNPVGACFLYKRTVFEKLGGFDESLFRLEDYDFWLRASTQFRFSHFPKVLYQYRQHRGSLTYDMQTNRGRRREIEVKAKRMYSRFFIKLGLSITEEESDMQAQLLLSNMHYKIAVPELDTYLAKWQAINSDRDFFDGLPFQRKLLRTFITSLSHNGNSVQQILEVMTNTRLWTESQLSWGDKWGVMIRQIYNLRMAPLVDHYLSSPTNISSPSGAP